MYLSCYLLRVFEEPRNSKPTIQHHERVANFIYFEMETQTATARLKSVLKHTVLPASNTTYEVEEKVIVFWINIIKHRINEWLGPFAVMGADMAQKLLYVQLEEKAPAEAFGLV